MLGKNYKYNWFDFSASKVYDTHVALSNVTHTTSQRTDIVDNVNDHGSTASNTLESGRVIVFEWYVLWLTKKERWDYRQALNNCINIEPYVNQDPFKKLEFQSDNWTDLRVMAKVNNKPTGTNWVLDSRIEFNFSLYANTNELYWTTLHTSTQTSWQFWGTSFPNSFGDSWWDTPWLDVCINAGNFKAGCKIEIYGAMTNPKIKNLTNGQEFKINWTTTALVLDSIWGSWTVTDGWEDIMYKRDYWVPIFLSPGDNYIFVSDDTGAEVAYTISWYDTYNTI